MDGVKKDETRDRRTYFSLHDGFFPKRTLRARGLSNNRIDDASQLSHRNHLFHEYRQGLLEPNGDTNPRSQDDQGLQKIKAKTSSDEKPRHGKRTEGDHRNMHQVLELPISIAISEFPPKNHRKRFSQPDPKIKKYHDFQSQKDEGKPLTILDFLSQGKSSKYP